MIRLRQLRSRLKSLGRRRRAARLAIGYSAILVAAAWLLVAVFLADWLLDMNLAQRIVVMAVAGAGLVWTFLRWTLPWLGPRETLIDLALMVQGQHHIDSDLVAAIQFERPEAARWGSVDMEKAVIEQVGRASRRLEMLLGVSTRQLLVRVALLAATVLVVGTALWQYGDYAAVFFNRLTLGSGRYQAETAIETVTINDQSVDLETEDLQEIQCAYGQPVSFEVTCSGRLPPTGRAVLKIEGSPERDVTLHPRRKPDTYSGRSDRLLDTASCRIVVGDDRTQPIRLIVSPPPVVDVFLDVTTPSYTAAPAPTETVSGLRQLAVIEGSRVRVRIVADKELQEATLAVQSLQGEATVTEAPPHPMKRLEIEQSPDGEVRDTWALDPAGTPLEKLVEPVRYVIHVTDVDGFQLERPIEGVIRVYADQPPQVFASARVQLVVPKARPTIEFQAGDDYGLFQIKALSEVIHADGSPGEKGEVTVWTLSPGEPPRKNIQDSHRLVLAPLKSAKGDRIKVVLQAVDYRGGAAKAPGKASLSDPIEFQVTDLEGILAAILEADRESARQYKTMIDDQVKVGGGR